MIFVVIFYYKIRHGDGAGNAVENSGIFPKSECTSCFQCLTLLVGRQEGHLALKKYVGMVEAGTGYSGWSGAQPDGQCVCLC